MFGRRRKLLNVTTAFYKLVLSIHSYALNIHALNIHALNVHYPAGKPFHLTAETVLRILKALYPPIFDRILTKTK